MTDNNCDCCAGVESITPEEIYNAPGLPALKYRVGTHSTFLETMMASLSSREFPALWDLTTRESGDPAIALLDAGAVMLDVLTFYQERISNEGYLRTATERRSVLELARLIGYKLRPGVAASVYLAFTLDNGYEVTIPVSTRAQSVPEPGQLPQPYETSDPLLAREAWNILKVRLTRPQFMTPTEAYLREKLYIQGTATNLRPNDPLVLAFGAAEGMQILHFVEAVEPFPEEDYTLVTLRTRGGIVAEDTLRIARSAVERFLRLEDFGLTEDREMVRRVLPRLRMLEGRLSRRVTEAELTDLMDSSLETFRAEHNLAVEGGFTRLEPWVGGLVSALEEVEAGLSGGTPRAASSLNGQNGRTSGLGGLIQPLLKPPSLQPRNATRLSRNISTLYGANADTLPRLITAFQPGLKDSLYAAWANTRVTRDLPLQNAFALRVKAAPFGHNAPLIVSRDEDTGDITGYSEWPLDDADDFFTLALDAEYNQITPGSWVVIERPSFEELEEFQILFRRVRAVRSVSKAMYGITGKVTQLTLDREWWDDAFENEADLSFFRRTTVYAQSEPLPLAEEPVADDIAGSDIELAELYDGLEPGRWAILCGERSDIPDTTGVMACELVMIAGVAQGVAQADIGDGRMIDLPGDRTHTTLQLASSMAYTYRRDSVTIYGNVVKATHGETREEVLGSGDASLPFQAFTLKQAPLTFTSAPTPSGIASSLTARVNAVRWPEVDGLIWLGVDERGYITRTGDDDKTTLVFGDGVHGARLPTGQENVTATYRFGIGKPGNATASQISLLVTRPLGVKSVINPLPATGGADKESRDQARENAPLAVMSLDRLVSVRDYADFARTFAGVGKASAARISDGRRELVHVTIAGADDIPIDPTSDLYQNLMLAFRRYNGDPFQPVQLAVRSLSLLVISAKVKLLADYEWESVEPQIRAAMLDAFGFARRQLGEDVISSQVISVIQAVPGVAYVDLDVLDSVGEDADLTDLEDISAGLTLNDRIRVNLARVDPDSTALPRPILPARLAYLSPEIPDTLILTELGK